MLILNNGHSNNCCRGKTINITYHMSVSILDLFIRHAKRMGRIILSPVSLSGCKIIFHVIS